MHVPLLKCEENCLTAFSVDLAEFVITHFVHETVEQNWRAFLVNSELARGVVIVPLGNGFPFLRAAANAHHP